MGLPHQSRRFRGQPAGACWLWAHAPAACPGRRCSCLFPRPGPPQVFLNRLERLVSCSKDGQLRVWELALQHCSQVVAGFRGEVWSLDVDAAESRLAVGARQGLGTGAGGGRPATCPHVQPRPTACTARQLPRPGAACRRGGQRTDAVAAYPLAAGSVEAELRMFSISATAPELRVPAAGASVEDAAAAADARAVLHPMGGVRRGVQERVSQVGRRPGGCARRCLARALDSRALALQLLQPASLRLRARGRLPPPL